MEKRRSAGVLVQEQTRPSPLRRFLRLRAEKADRMLPVSPITGRVCGLRTGRSRAASAFTYAMRGFAPSRPVTLLHHHGSDLSGGKLHDLRLHQVLKIGIGHFDQLIMR